MISPAAFASTASSSGGRSITMYRYFSRAADRTASTFADARMVAEFASAVSVPVGRKESPVT